MTSRTKRAYVYVIITWFMKHYVLRTLSSSLKHNSYSYYFSIKKVHKSKNKRKRQKHYSEVCFRVSDHAIAKQPLYGFTTFISIVPYEQYLKCSIIVDNEEQLSELYDYTTVSNLYENIKSFCDIVDEFVRIPLY